MDELIVFMSGIVVGIIAAFLVYSLGSGTLMPADSWLCTERVTETGECLRYEIKK